MMRNWILTGVVAASVLSFSFHLLPLKKFIPPGTIAVSSTLFADECEISNLAWREYVYWTGMKYGAGSSEQIATYPDTLVWRNKLSYNEPYVTHYFRHHAYRDYPVVGVSHAQALAFCKWRSERVMEFHYRKHKESIRVRYRLPTEEEWEYLAMSGSNTLARDGIGEKGEALLNCRTHVTVTARPYPEVFCPVKWYGKNPFGLYNMFGNVAEMVEEPNISKGGGWKNLAEECRAGKRERYEKPEAWLGFRCVCDLQ